MERICKKISWLNVASLVAILIGMIFGIVAICSIKNADEGIKYVLIGVLVIVTVISLISGIIAFFGMRKGEPKTAVLGLSRNSSIQLIGPLTAFILGVMGLSNQEKVNGAMITFLVIAFILTCFTTSLIIKSLKGYRKDKETYRYTSIVSFISVVTLVIFMIASLIGQSQLKAIEGTHTIGYLIAFSIFFCLSDIICYVGLGILTACATKYAPEKTAADADAKVFDEMLNGIKKISDTPKTTSSTMGVADQLREYKKLMDEGIITPEEFEKKKKELL